MNKILIIGACGQIGTELTEALIKQHGENSVIATDIRVPMENPFPLFQQLDALDARAIFDLVKLYNVKTIYHLSAMLSATGEKKPRLGWNLNTESLLNVLGVAVDTNVKQLFWPSSIAVFGRNAPKKDCPQSALQHPSTVYGISKTAGELWCEYFYKRYGLDVRSLRYPGLISYKAAPGGGTTDYAVDIYHKALMQGRYTCFLNEDTRLPMMYMPDAIRATMELMEAPAGRIGIRTSYNLSGMSFTPSEIAASISQHLPGFQIDYDPDYRQDIAESWPGSIDDMPARRDWGWQEEYDLDSMTGHMLQSLKKLLPSPLSL